MPRARQLTVETVVELFAKEARAELDARWRNWKIDLSHEEIHECVGALLARQVTLATRLALAPSFWTGHTAPLILRSMADVFITLAWILCEPLERSRRFILHGLGALKLAVEHRKAAIAAGEADPREELLVEFEERWINSQQFTFLTEVELGSWSGLSARAMAKEAGEEDFYNYVYTPFSACTHSMWHHIAKYNLIRCESPLHRHHFEPMDPDLGLDVHYVYLASKYLDKSFRRFDEVFQISVSVTSAHENLVRRLQALDKKNREDGDREYERARQRALARLDRGFDLGWTPPASRDELHER